MAKLVAQTADRRVDGGWDRGRVVEEGGDKAASDAAPASTAADWAGANPLSPRQQAWAMGLDWRRAVLACSYTQKPMNELDDPVEVMAQPTAGGAWWCDTPETHCDAVICSPPAASGWPPSSRTRGRQVLWVGDMGKQHAIKQM